MVFTSCDPLEDVNAETLNNGDDNWHYLIICVSLKSREL